MIAFNNAKNDLEKEPMQNSSATARRLNSLNSLNASLATCKSKSLTCTKLISTNSATEKSNLDSNNFDKLCTDVRQCKYLPKSRLKIRSINDFNLPNCRSSSES